MPTELSPEEIDRSHRWHAIECNNLAWDLSIQVNRTHLQDEEMLNAAHASAFHWAKVGTDLNQARAKMLLAQVYATLGIGQAATEFARHSYNYIASHESPDWEVAFAHAILAHAAHASGDDALHKQHYSKAQELGRAMADPEDRQVIFKNFHTVPIL